MGSILNAILFSKNCNLLKTKTVHSTWIYFFNGGTQSEERRVSISFIQLWLSPILNGNFLAFFSLSFQTGTVWNLFFLHTYRWQLHHFWQQKELFLEVRLLLLQWWRWWWSNAQQSVGIFWNANCQKPNRVVLDAREGRGVQHDACVSFFARAHFENLCFNFHLNWILFILNFKLWNLFYFVPSEELSFIFFFILIWASPFFPIIFLGK